ncbi:hypothetical protein, partial [Klebsiella aerogenes]
MADPGRRGRLGPARTSEGAGGEGRVSRRMMRQYELVERVKRYNPAADEDLLNRAYVYAMRAHGAQKRASG